MNPQNEVIEIQLEAENKQKLEEKDEIKNNDKSEQTSEDGDKCRICFENINIKRDQNDILSPCRCTGSMGLIHITCFEQMNIDKCDICGFTIKIKITDEENKIIRQRLMQTLDNLENKFIGLHNEIQFIRNLNHERPIERPNHLNINNIINLGDLNDIDDIDDNIDNDNDNNNNDNNDNNDNDNDNDPFGYQNFLGELNRARTAYEILNATIMILPEEILIKENEIFYFRREMTDIYNYVSTIYIENELFRICMICLFLFWKLMDIKNGIKQLLWMSFKITLFILSCNMIIGIKIIHNIIRKINPWINYLLVIILSILLIVQSFNLNKKNLHIEFLHNQSSINSSLSGY